MSEFAGLLQTRVEIWRRTEDRLSTGLSADNWERVGTYRAHIEVEGAGKPVEGMSLSALPRYRVKLRNVSPFQVDQRVRWGGRLLCVRQVIINPLKPDRVTLHCEELRG